MKTRRCRQAEIHGVVWRMVEMEMQAVIPVYPDLQDFHSLDFSSQGMEALEVKDCARKKD